MKLCFLRLDPQVTAIPTPGLGRAHREPVDPLWAPGQAGVPVIRSDSRRQPSRHSPPHRHRSRCSVFDQIRVPFTSRALPSVYVIVRKLLISQEVLPCIWIKLEEKGLYPKPAQAFLLGDLEASADGQLVVIFWTMREDDQRNPAPVGSALTWPLKTRSRLHWSRQLAGQHRLPVRFIEAPRQAGHAQPMSVHHEGRRATCVIVPAVICPKSLLQAAKGPSKG